MNCDNVREQLTAYLDGELEGDRGTAVRGHLRTCDACRAMSADEAALRDGLRSLPPVDPPASLWASVQAQLAKEEVVESQRPAWKRAVSRWLPMAPRFALGMTAVAAAAVLLLVWRSHHHPRAHEELPVAVTVPHETAPVAPPAAPDATMDVTAEIAAAPAKTSDDLAQAAKGLLADARTESARWTEDQKRTFEAEVGELQAAVDGAAEGRARHKAYRAMIRYLQGAAIRDEVALR
ncbi:MAG TPA: anti-sigma factor [Kofleriaceae bacterium]|nr:anti-sigma factor [Kofleriaceae bacterium]